MPLLLLLAIPVLIAIVVVVAAGRADRESSGRLSSFAAVRLIGTDPPLQQQVTYWHDLAVKRLVLAGKLERQRNFWHRHYLAKNGKTDVPWLNDALCIHSHESVDWRNRGHHFGGMQFNIGTWRSVGGFGNPAAASPVEQLYRAFLVWARDGYSWREWSTAGTCGLR